VLGPNGAGKSTTLRVIAGLHPALDGDVVLCGRRVNDAEPDELKRQAGRDVVEIRVRHAADLARAGELLAPCGVDAPRLDGPNRRVNVPVEAGADQLTQAVQALARAGVAIDDIGLRRPTLDEVFLALTGRPATDDIEPLDEPVAA
jgi:ABC-2 type transport system ATP-binding protein